MYIYIYIYIILPLGSNIIIGKFFHLSKPSSYHLLP